MAVVVERSVCLDNAAIAFEPEVSVACNCTFVAIGIVGKQIKIYYQLSWVHSMRALHIPGLEYNSVVNWGTVVVVGEVEEAHVPTAGNIDKDKFAAYCSCSYHSEVAVQHTAGLDDHHIEGIGHYYSNENRCLTSQVFYAEIRGRCGVLESRLDGTTKK